MSFSLHSVRIFNFGTVPYRDCVDAMQKYTESRDEFSDDQLWILEHPPVFTQGQAGKDEHLLDTGAIPVEQTDRGGQVTYHGPGQIVVYLLVDIRRLGLGVRGLVDAIEQCVVDLLREYDIDAAPRPDAPGVYVDGAKIAQLGLRIKRGCSYHGLSFNYAMDMSPFAGINPCGYQGLEVLCLHDLLPDTLPTRDEIVAKLAWHLTERLGYESAPIESVAWPLES